MNNIEINKCDADKFIFKGSLALELYYDYTNINKDIIDEFYFKLNEYRKLTEKNKENKEYIVNELINVIEKLRIKNFTIYNDGDIEYNYNNI